MLTMSDFFCGAGGSSTGAIAVPGVEVRIAANHWAIAVGIHNANHPNTDHSTADLHLEDPRFFPRTDIAWFSPECTKWSQAAGRQRPAIEEGLFADPWADDIAARSRLLMFDVLRFAEHHRYDAMIIENVIDIAVSAKYALAWTEWQRQLRNIGYRYRVVSLNAMHSQMLGLPAPQSRDRLYVVCWRNGAPEPQIEQALRPQAWCPRCERLVESRQSWKNGRTVGRYRAQYVYVHGDCGTVVEPGWLPAYTAIDWTVPGTPIGGRARPLADKTRDRVAAGIARYWMEPFTAEVAGHTYERVPGVRTRALGDPFGTFTTTNTRALLVPVEGREGKQAQPTDVPARTQTARNETGLVVPSGGTWNEDATPASDPLRTVTTRDAYAVAHLPFLAELRGGSSDARSVGEPAATFTAGGNHHALITAYYGTGDNTRPATDELGTVTTVDRHALIMRNNSGGLQEYMRTITTAAHQSLIQHPGPRPPRPRPSEEAIAAAERVVDDCLFRMLTPLEAAAGMAFPSDYKWRTDEGKKLSDRHLVKLAGNAVCPPSARDLVATVAQALSQTGNTT